MVTDLALAVAQSIATPDDFARSIGDHVRLATLAAEQGAQLVLFPELSLTGYHLQYSLHDAIAVSDPRLRSLQAVADSQGITITVGAPLASLLGLHIGALSFIPEGNIQVYYKTYPHESELVAFTAGPAVEPLDVGVAFVGLAICADLTHAEHPRAAREQGCTIYAAGCFISPKGYGRDTGLLSGYAREHRMAVLMANYGSETGGEPSAGRSAAWSPTGKLLATAPEAGEALLLVTRHHGEWEGEVLAGR